MKDSQTIKYPYARLTGLNRFMEILQTDLEWKPDVIDIDLLKTLEIAPSKERETIFALKFLGLIGDSGMPTDEFDNLRKDYQGTMRRLVVDKYGQLFKQIPSGMINQSRLVKFFGLSADTSEYQAKLFAWLCEQAGIELTNLEKQFHRARFDKNNGNGH